MVSLAGIYCPEGYNSDLLDPTSFLTKHLILSTFAYGK